MSGTERPAKRARLEADKRRDVLAKVQDQYADIDFTRFQKAVDADETGEATPYRFVLVRPTETALVKDWRQWSSYEPDGTGETLSEEGLAHLCSTGRQRRHYTGPFGCTVQSNLPAPGELLSKAGSAVQGRTALDKLRKQLAVMCLRIELKHFIGVSDATIDAAALGRANSNGAWQLRRQHQRPPKQLPSPRQAYTPDHTVALALCAWPAPVNSRASANVLERGWCCLTVARATFLRVRALGCHLPPFAAKL